MALQNILELITHEAEAEANRIRENAEHHAQEIREKREEEAATRVRSIIAEKDSHIAGIQKRHETRMRMEQRSILAQKKSEVLDMVFAAAKERLKKTAGAELEAIFSALLAQIPSSEGTVILLGGWQKEAFEKAVKKTGKAFSLSEEKDVHGGGFLFRAQNFEMDFSFENLLEKIVRPRIEGKLSTTLFA